MLETINTIGGVSGIISLISLFYVVFTKLGRMEVKICTLWQIYGEGVLERAVREGFARPGSAIRITKKGEDLLGENIKQKIKVIVERKRYTKLLFVKYDYYGNDLKYFVINEAMNDIKRRAHEKDIEIETLVSTAILYTEKVCNSP